MVRSLCAFLALVGCGRFARAQGELPLEASASSGTLFRWDGVVAEPGASRLESPLVTDRPDFTEASSTVGQGVWQLELGYTFAADRSNGLRTRTHSYPEALLRVGVLAEWFELRLGQTIGEESSGLSKLHGADDLYFGFKIGLTPQREWLPEMALIPQTTFPTGSEVFNQDRFLAGVNWIYSWELNDRISTAGSTQFNSRLDESSGEVFAMWAQSWTVGYSLTDRIGAYTEWFAFFPHGADTARPEYYFNGGFTVLASSDFQWDIRAGTGLNSAADDFFIGTGFSYRYWR